jgi:hypothetical protein
MQRIEAKIRFFGNLWATRIELSCTTRSVPRHDLRSDRSFGLGQVAEQPATARVNPAVSCHPAGGDQAGAPTKTPSSGSPFKNTILFM